MMIALEDTAGQMSSVDVMRELKAQAREHMITELLPSDFFSTNRNRAVTRSTAEVTWNVCTDFLQNNNKTIWNTDQKLSVVISHCQFRVHD